MVGALVVGLSVEFVDGGVLLEALEVPWEAAQEEPWAVVLLVALEVALVAGSVVVLMLLLNHSRFRGLGRDAELGEAHVPSQQPGGARFPDPGCGVGAVGFQSDWSGIALRIVGYELVGL